jgi:cyclic beta-1,2-glucan synthetase
VEPYVMAADIYCAPPHTGRGGWTWYTGAAGWMYRLAVETLLGFSLEVDKLRLSPRVPQTWDSFKIHYRFRETFYHIVFTRVSESAPQGAGTRKAGSKKAAGVAPVSRVVLDGVELHQSADNRNTIPLLDDRRDHRVEVLFG